MKHRCIALVTALFLLCHGGLGREQESEEPAYTLGRGITPPKVILEVSPNASRSKGFRVNGAVLIGLVVSSRGEPREVKVISSIEKDIDQAAVEAVEQWKFEPAMKDGKPVAVRISVEIRFHDL